MPTRRTEADLPRIEVIPGSRESSEDSVELDEDELRGSQSQLDEASVDPGSQSLADGPEASPQDAPQHPHSPEASPKKRGRPSTSKHQAVPSVSLGAPTSEGFATLVLKDSARGVARVYSEAINSIATRSDEVAATVTAHGVRLAGVVQTPAETQNALSELRAGLASLHKELQNERRRASESESATSLASSLPDESHSKLQKQHAYLHKLGDAFNALTRRVANAEEEQQNLAARCGGFDARLKSLEAAQDALPNLDVHRGGCLFIGG